MLPLLIGTLLAVGVLNAKAAGATTLEAVRKRGHLMCGVADGAVGFSVMSASGHWSGLDVEFCRAIAAAVLGNKDDVRFVPVTTGMKFKVVRSGDVDLLARSTEWTLSRDVGEGVRFVGALYHESQAFLVRRSQGITSALELSGGTICTLEGSRDSEQAMAFFRARGMRTKSIVHATWAKLVTAYANGQCVALSADRTQLAFEMSRLGGVSTQIILPELISHDPLGPVVRGGDDQWFSIVRWALFGLIAAEQHKIGWLNLPARASNSMLPELKQMLGSAGDLGKRLGLSRNWAELMIGQVGNYGDIYDRVLGARSAIHLPRGRNALISDGGLLWAPPFR